MRHVMRLGVGDSIIVFDGSGNDFAAQIQALGKNEVHLALGKAERVERELTGELTVAASLPKGDRQRFLIEKLVELGTTAFVPLMTHRGVAQPTDSARQRLKRTVIEASKQSGRSCLMRIDPPLDADTFFARAAQQTKLIASFGGRPLHGTAWTSSVTVAVGPEGGFTSAEFDSAIACGWKTVSLGPRVLRVETAATLLAAVAATQPELCGRLPEVE